MCSFVATPYKTNEDTVTAEAPYIIVQPNIKFFNHAFSKGMKWKIKTVAAVQVALLIYQAKVAGLLH